MAAKDQAILAQLDATAERGVRPERAKAALADVPALPETLFALEAELTRATDDAEEKLQGAARHLVSAGGKRIRPMVTLLACGACGGEMTAAVPFAVAAELTHSATLLHDDVIDDGPVRRGQPASRVIWGNAVSVLSGDWLLTRALEIVAGEPAAKPRARPAPRHDAPARRGRGAAALAARHVRRERAGLPRRRDRQDRLALRLGRRRRRLGRRRGRRASPRRSSASARGSASPSSSWTTPSTTPPTRACSARSSATDLLEGKATLPLIRACEARAEPARPAQGARRRHGRRRGGRGAR